MRERVLRVSLDRRDADRPDELAVRQLVEPEADALGVGRAHRGDRRGPEHPPDHRRVLHERLLLGGQGVEPRRDDGLQALRGVARQGRGLGGAGRFGSFVEHPRELLREQRVAPGPLGDQRRGRRIRCRARRTCVEEPEGLPVAQGGERDHDRVAHPAAPPRVALQHLGSRGAHDQHREARRPLEHVLDELDHRGLRPVEVLDRDHERADRRDRLEEATPRAEGLRLLDRVRLRVGQADQRGESGPEPLVLGAVLDEPLDAGGELGAGRSRRRRTRGCPPAPSRSARAPST